LLSDLGASLRTAAAASSAGQEPLQLARLHFAHCETLTPLLTLLGLFGGEGAQREAAAAAGGAAAGGAASTWQQAQADLAGVDSLVDDAQLLVARRLAESRGAGAAAGEDGPSEYEMSGGGSSARSSMEQVYGYGSADEGDSGYQGLGRSSLDSSGASSASGSSGSSPRTGRGHGPEHKHGPRAVGCVYKGRALSGGPLPPPPGWAPRVGPVRGDRPWRGGRIAPLGANLVVALYRSTRHPGRHLVRFIHNEQVLAPAFCGGRTDCDLEEFLEGVVAGSGASAAQLLQMCGGGAAGAAGLQLLTTADGLPLVF